MPQPDLTVDELAHNNAVERAFVSAMRECVLAEDRKADEGTLHQKRLKALEAAIAYGRTVNLSVFDDIVQQAMKSKGV